MIDRSRKFKSKRGPKPGKMDETRQKQILEAATHLAVDKGYQNITRAQVALVARVSVGSINLYFTTMEYLKQIVLRDAIASENLVIIAQGLAANDPLLIDAPVLLLRRAAESLAESAGGNS